MRNRKNQLVITVLSVLLIATGCKKDNASVTYTYTVPGTYNFSNVSYSGQLVLLAMADQVVAKINTANTSPNTVVSAQLLKDMFNNVNGYFVDSALQLNNSGLRLADYCAPLANTDLLNYFDSVGLYSQSPLPGTWGVAGVSSSSANPNKRYLLSPNGVFYSQVVKKSFMGGLCNYMINKYLTDSIAASVDNNTVVSGMGTALEHHWDEAFGFFGAPISFPATATGLRYLASYSNQVDAGLGSNSSIMNAYLTGRAAISGKDLTTMKQQANLLISTLDSLDAAAIVQEMKETDENIEAGDAVAAYGTLSETLGFIRNLRYIASSKRVITDAQITQLESLLDSGNPTQPNLYQFVDANGSTKGEIEAKTNAIRQFIGKVYGFTEAQLAAQ